ncbi:putative disease resistance protein At3g14460 [Arachis stenosperma]|uniref:putative disease resistance protein At3g14460 n=1 Tax=Arachis stenosperma TaxID=217475 RepID=UPI0025ABB28D|nr:putative disease resistance protein At3g14460 [Arachis stenosperma]
MAAKLYGGAYLSPFVDAVLDNLSSILEDDSVLNGNNSALELLERLQNCLCDVGPVLDDAELKQFTDKKVKKWLVDLQDALYMADDLLHELSTKAAIAATQRDPGNSSFWSRLVDSCIEDNGNMEKVVGKLESVVRRKHYLSLEKSAKVDMSWRITSTSLLEPSEICGRKEDKKAILKLLLDDDAAADGDLSVIPIVGMGGIGKTTLAQMVYYDDKVNKNFDFRGWVCVSAEFDVVKVTKTIIEAITSNSCNLTDLNLLQLDLKEKLSRQKFFIVLDDVWNENYEDWTKLLKPFQKGVKGSKILITTRSKKVAYVVQTVLPHELTPLSDEDCWLVFSKHARLSTVSVENPTLERIGRDMVKRCDGLPLAAQALGGLLRGNSDVKYWNQLMKSEIWELSDVEINVVPALRISYYFLPSHLKQCFVYCSLYPKDYEFSKNKLILLWMAENFLQPIGEKTMEEVGDEYFDELIARSFFQPHNTRRKRFVMHDIMHDLAMLIAREFYFRAEKFQNTIEVDKIRRLSHNAKGDYPMSKLLKVCDRIKHTRTFLEINLEPHIPFNMENAPCILLSQLKFLRALSFKCFPLDSLPDSIGELIHLRYLNLSETYIVTLPESLGNLYNLQTLKLLLCCNLKMLPDSMQDLINLRCLDIRGTRLHEMPKGMSKLESLHFLSNYVVGKHEENKIKELGALTNLQKSITITKLENVVNSSEALEARMFDKDGIDSLWLRWSWDEAENIVDFQIEREILDKLQPYSDLKELQIEGYRGTTFPDWLGHSSYYNITEVTLDRCWNCCMLPSLGQLPSLRHLTISNFVNLGIVGAEFYFCQNDESCLETPFQMLETLKFSSMPWWEEWQSLEFNAFPRLRVLIISECPMLRGDLPIHLPSLQSLEIQNCELLSYCVPRTPGMTSLIIRGSNEVRIGELPPLLGSLSIERSDHLVQSVVEAITLTQLTCLTYLRISGCSSQILFPVSAIPPSLQQLKICDCKELEFQMDGQHHSLQELLIEKSCSSLTSFSLLDSFPNLVRVQIKFCGKMESVAVARSLPRLRSLEINHCWSLKSVSTLWMAAPQLEKLSVLKCPEIDLSPTGDPHRSLRSLSISYYQKQVISAAFMNSQFHGLTDLHIEGAYRESISVKCFPKEGWLPASLESLSLIDMKSVETLECKGLAHLTSLQRLRIDGCAKLENIEGEKLPASLIRLTISRSPLLSKLCEMKDPQLWPKISHIPGILVDDRWIW